MDDPLEQSSASGSNSHTHAATSRFQHGATQYNVQTDVEKTHNFNTISPIDEENTTANDNYWNKMEEDMARRIQLAKENHDNFIQDYAPRTNKLSMFSTACLLINRMIGTGIFETPKTVWMSTGSVAGSLFMWCVGGLISYAGLAVYLELGLTIPRYLVPGRHGPRWMSVPRSGGEKNYLEYIFAVPRFLATCIYAVIFIFLGNTSGNSIVFATNFLEIIQYRPDSVDPVDINDYQTGWIVKGIAVAVVTVACLLHGAWRAGGIHVQNSLAMVKLGILWFFIIAGLVAYSGKLPGIQNPGEELSVGRSFKKGFNQDYGAHGWIATLLDVSFSFGGFESANYVLSEVKDPARKLKWSTMSALTIVFISYILANISFFTVVTAESLMQKPDSKISTEFIHRVFAGSHNAKRALPALIAISAFGNILVTTFMTSKVKQEIAKEGVLPFSAFWRAEYDSPFSKFLGRRQPPPPNHYPRGYQPGGYQNRHRTIMPSIPEEKTPIPALFLHWITSLILILSPPAKDTYSLFTRLYSYMTHAWFGVFLAGGLLYVGYYKQYKADYYSSRSTANSSSPNPHNAPGTGYQWKTIAGYRPPGGPILPLIYFISSLAMIIGAWIPPTNGEEMASSGLGWFVVPTIGVGLFGVGVAYWFVLMYVLPIFYHKTLRVKRTPHLDREHNFRFEEVTTSWIAGDDQEEVEVDPHLVM